MLGLRRSLRVLVGGEPMEALVVLLLAYYTSEGAEEVVAFAAFASAALPFLVPEAGCRLRRCGCNDPLAPETVAHDALMRVRRSKFGAGRYDPEHPLTPWLCRIVRNCAVDYLHGIGHSNPSLE